MSQSHTPGPWRAADPSALKGDWTCHDDDSGQSTWQPIVRRDGKAVALIVDSSRSPFGGCRASFDNDARLIAAAPDLLAAAQCAANVLSLLDAEVKALGLRAENVPERLRAAIARATS